MSDAILALLTLLAQIAPLLKTGSAVTNIIDLLVKLLPTIVKEIEDVAPYIRNIINALRNNADITPEQLAELDALEAKADAEFEAAADMPDSDGMPQ